MNYNYKEIKYKFFNYELGNFLLLENKVNYLISYNFQSILITFLYILAIYIAQILNTYFFKFQFCI